MNPFLSIVIPVYNIENYLMDCVNSVFFNLNERMELILVDDGSTDGSLKICDSLVKIKPNIKVIHKKNGGLSDARNVGIENSKGDYILFIDGDDFIAKNSIEKIMNACLNSNRPDVLFLKGYKYYNNDFVELLDEELDENKIYNRNKFEVLEYISKLKKYPGSVCTKLIKRSLIVENSILFKVGKKSEDLDWTKQILFAANTFGLCNADYYYYRQNRIGSITATSNYNNFRDVVDVVNAWIEEAKYSDDLTRNILFSFSCYQYKVLMSLAGHLKRKLGKVEKVRVLNWLRENIFLLRYRSDRHTKIIRCFVRICGLDITITLLSIYMKFLIKLIGRLKWIK